MVARVARVAWVNSAVNRAVDVVLGRVDDADGPRRLLHGRGGCYEGFHDVNFDWYPPYVVVSAFSEGPYAEVIAGLADHRDVAGIVVQTRRGRATTAEVVAGEVPQSLVCREAGLDFKIQPHRNQNIGLFLDMSGVRQWVREHASGARVLNLFAYTCAFSVYAIDGGAAQVVNNDMSRPALDWGQDNHRLNDHDMRCVSMVPHNLFKSWWKLRQLGPYDLVIVDPPTRQRGSFVAEKDYGQVMKRLEGLLAPGGRAIVCLNSPFMGFDFIEHQMTARAGGLKFDRWLAAAPEFEEANPQAGLKVGVYSCR